MSVAAKQKGMVESRADSNRLASEAMRGNHRSNCRTMLLAQTVPMARIAPSAVDMEAAAIPIMHQAPKKGGAWWINSLMNASCSGFQRPQVGKPSGPEHESASNVACTESGP
jgi:hypothetical protein